MRKLCWLSLVLSSVMPVIHAAVTLPISQIPLALINPARPKVLIAVANSQSMDGNLSGAIMVGSGALSTSLGSLSSSSSPVSYTVPNGFTPPVQGANSSNIAPYTVTQLGQLVDNSDSRLNVAKAGIGAIIDAYLSTTDFALETYSTSNTTIYNTWVYYMSPTNSNFNFTNNPIDGNRYVTNPCYYYLFASPLVNQNCSSIASLYGASNLFFSSFMQIGASSDDANINDILYARSLASVFVTYNGPNPSTPYPPNFSIANYNVNNVFLSYRSVLPSFAGSFGTAPTNAGFVPFSNQVMYAQRGFGYGSSQSATSGNIIVPMTDLGANPSANSITNANNTFASFLKPETSNPSSNEIKALAGQSPMAGLMTRALTYLNTVGTSSSGSACTSKKYVILISDGLPTLDLNNRSWPPLGSAAAAGYNVSATFNTDGSLNTTNNQAVRDTITAIANLRKAGINTFIVGLGAGVNPLLNPQAAQTLKAMAVAGGTIDYYPATDPEALVDDLNNILVSVQSGSLSITSAAVGTIPVQQGNVAYQASFTSQDTPFLDWTGNLVAQSLDTSSGSPTVTTLWSASRLLDNLVAGSGWSNNRLIATWDPTFNRNTGRGVPFTWPRIDSTQRAQLNPQGSSRLDYLRGNTNEEVRRGGRWRNRSHILGDIVNSNPVFVGVPNSAYFSINGYSDFVTAQANRPGVLYVGANDGMLHAFDASTGRERFAFIPNAVFNNLSTLADTTYNQSHLYFVDGSPQAADVQFNDSSWHTLVVGGESGGGNSIYALDVTNPAAINSENNLASTILWEYTETDLGLTYSEPEIAPINPTSTTTQRFAVFFGNGYNSANNKAVLYALDPETGALIRKMDLCALVANTCDVNKPQGLSSVAFGNKDGISGAGISQVYAGDLQGNLWSIDVSSSTPSQWQARVLFKARDKAGVIQPITTAPVVTLHPLYPRYQGLFVIFGTGQFLTVNDLTDTQTQTIYGVWDKPIGTRTFTRADLQSQTLSLIGLGVSGLNQDIILSTNNDIGWATQVGWYTDLLVGGQRINGSPQLLNGAVLTTLITPPLNICTANFTSVFLELNYITGGGFFNPQLDISNDGIINVADTYNGSYAVGIGLADAGIASRATILPGLDVNGNKVKLLTYSTGNQSTVINPTVSPKIRSWWQIQ